MSFSSGAMYAVNLSLSKVYLVPEQYLEQGHLGHVLGFQVFV